MRSESTLTNEYFFNFAFTPCLPGALSMGIDEALGRNFPYAVPVIRFFTWSGYTISVGRNQDPEKRLKLELCREDCVDVVRRPTGGKELLHGHDLCYSVIWPVRGSDLASRASGLFARINDILVSSLSILGIDCHWKRSLNRRGGNRGPCFTQVDRGEIISGGGKLLASAQRVFGETVLQQGSMPLERPSVDLSLYLRRFDRGEIAGKLASNTIFFNDLVGETLSPASIVEVFKSGFERFLGFESRSFGKDLENMSQIILQTQK